MNNTETPNNNPSNQDNETSSIEINTPDQVSSDANDDSLGSADNQDNGTEFSALQEQVAQQADEIAKLKDAFLRAKAEEDNVRRRADKEIANRVKFAVEGFAKELLNVRDSLVLAAKQELAEDAADSVRSLHEGVDITLKQLDSVFAKFSITEVEAKPGDALDPNVHQAMSLVDADGVESGCIVDVIQSGFMLHERLLRPSLVVVAN